MKPINWQLSSAYEIAVRMLERPDINFRVQLHYYRKTNNKIMIDRLEEAKKIVKLLAKAQT